MIASSNTAVNASGVSYDCNQDLQSSFGVTWRIYEVVRKIYYLKLQDLFSVSLAGTWSVTVAWRMAASSTLSMNAMKGVASACSSAAASAW
ncbi:MAG: hypothetical protein IPI17_13180 [Nitrosomonas sp.]|nr:hypothetical protein [Nitrosomonas sp.]